MNSFTGSGKIQDAFFRNTIYPFCGADRQEVTAGPQYGVDVAVINLPNGMDMALTSDPLSLIPRLGLQESAWLSVHLMANDMATTGVAPMYAQLVFNLPEQTTGLQFEEYWQHIHRFCSDMKVAITGGHTGKAEGQQSTMAGGGTMIAIAPANTFLLSSHAQPGDVIIITEEAALLATSILALSFPETVKNKCGHEHHHAACGLFYQTSSLQAGLTAVDSGPDKQVTAMHDVTEGGLLGALYELATAAGCGAVIEVNQLPVGETQQAICDLFHINPLFCVGAGSMIITARPDASRQVLQRLQEKGIRVTVAGSLTEKEKGIIIRQDGRQTKLLHPGTDPYWAAFFTALKNGWQ
jgi:hydrogenase expression/formation protein HypE